MVLAQRSSLRAVNCLLSFSSFFLLVPSGDELVEVLMSLLKSRAPLMTWNLLPRRQKQGEVLADLCQPVRVSLL